MKFEPVFTSVVPEGKYKFKITQAVDTASKAGEAMLKLTFAIHDELNKGTVYTNFNAKRAGLLRGLAEAINLVKEYETGEMVGEQFLGKTGECVVVVKDDQYGKKNDVVKFMGTDVSPTDMGSLASDVPF
jgi:hypothetical protein